MNSGQDDFDNWGFQDEDNYDPMQNSDGSIFFPQLAEQWCTEAVSPNYNNVVITGNLGVKLQNGDVSVITDTPETPEKTTPLPSIASWFQDNNESLKNPDQEVTNSSKYYSFKDQGSRGFDFSQYLNGHQDQSISMEGWNGLPSPCWNCGALPKPIGDNVIASGISSPDIQIISPSPSNLETTAYSQPEILVTSQLTVAASPTIKRPRLSKKEQNEVNAYILPSDLHKRKNLAVADIQKRLGIAGKPVPSENQIVNLWRRRKRKLVA